MSRVLSLLFYILRNSYRGMDAENQETVISSIEGEIQHILSERDAMRKELDHIHSNATEMRKELDHIHSNITTNVRGLMRAIEQKQKIYAIKYVRNLTAMGLKEAKDFVESFHHFNIPQKRCPRCNVVMNPNDTSNCGYCYNCGYQVD